MSFFHFFEINARKNYSKTRAASITNLGLATRQTTGYDKGKEGSGNELPRQQSLALEQVLQKRMV